MDATIDVRASPRARVSIRQLSTEFHWERSLARPSDHRKHPVGDRGRCQRLPLRDTPLSKHADPHASQVAATTAVARRVSLPFGSHRRGQVARAGSSPLRSSLSTHKGPFVASIFDLTFRAAHSPPGLARSPPLSTTIHPCHTLICYYLLRLANEVWRAASSTVFTASPLSTRHPTRKTTPLNTIVSAPAARTGPSPPRPANPSATNL
jgi:hypothetical protein